MIKHLFRSAIAALVVLGLISTAAGSAFADTLGDVKDRGVVRIGVKADYRPWGFRDPSGKIIGMEIDLAQDVANRLGVDLKTVPVVGSNRMQFLQQGKIDIIIATMSDTEKRRKVIGIVHPNYYSSGTNVMANKKYGLKKWEDLRGKTVCGLQGSWYNKRVSKKYGAKFIAFKGNPEIHTALKQDQCVGYVYDDSAIGSWLADKDKWGDFEMPLQTEDDTPWGIAVRLEERTTAFGAFMSGVIYDWHETGKLIELEKKWGIKPTAYLKTMHAKHKDFLAE